MRLSGKPAFERVYAAKTRHSDGSLLFYSVPNDGLRARLGLAVARRVGTAVVRNRIKRLLREAFWARAEALPDGLDFVIVARPPAGELARDGGGTAIEEALRVVLDEAGLTSGGGPA